MADFSLRTLFVVPVGNALPTTGSTENLAENQFGVYKDLARTAATAANISTANFIQFAQGRPASRLGSKISDKIKSTKVKQYYKITGNATAANEIWQFSNFSAQCDQTLTLTLRGHSSYLDTVSFNGFTQSLSILTPCCECGETPCAAIDNETIIDLFIAKAQQVNSLYNQPNSLSINTFWTFEKQGTGDSAVLLAYAKPLVEYSKFCNIALNPYEFDRIWFQGWVYVQPETSVDFVTEDRCSQAAEATIVQRSSFPRGTAAQIRQQQINYYSYQSPDKHLWQLSEYNQRYDDLVVDGTVYDQYVIVFDELSQDDSWTANLKEDETVLIAIPTALASGLETVLSPYLGAVENKSGPAITTTTTTSTTTTSTTSTTSLIP